MKSITAEDKNTVVVTYGAPNPNHYQWGVGGQSLIPRNVRSTGLGSVGDLVLALAPG